MNSENENGIAVVDDQAEKPHLSLETATRFSNKLRQSLCKNAIVEVVNQGMYERENKDGTKVKDIDWGVRGDGCRNQRRNGSAFCQECSDKHKQNI